MIFPFESLHGASRELGLIAGLAIGFAFGFVLERAGFGRATKLAAQFYLRDMTVFKVMFSAIVTAMLGLVLCDAVGFCDLRAISQGIASWTYLWPMLVGGFVLGIGFILSGYCPGTSIVAASSGNVDGMVTVGGVMAGSWLYSELMRFPAVADFHVSGERGALFLYDLLPVSPRLIAAAIALAAIAAFVGAEKVEAIFARGGAIRLRGSRRLAFGVIGLGAALSIASIPIPQSVPAPAATPGELAVPQLARTVVESPWAIRILDVRSPEAFAEVRIPGSEIVAPGDLEALLEAERREVVVVTDDGVLPEGSELPAHARILTDGFAAWKGWALTAPDASATGSRDEIAFRASVVTMMTGAAAAAPPPPPTAAPVARPKKKGGGCSV